MSFGHFNSEFQEKVFNVTLVYWARLAKGCNMAQRALVNPLRAKFFRWNINIYLHFVSLLHIDTTQLIEILPQIRQERTYSK